MLGTRGRLIGINLSGNQDRCHGYSIAVDVAKRVVSHIIHSGRAESTTRGNALLLMMSKENWNLVKRVSLGVLIKLVPRNSPGEDAGLQGTVILEDSDGIFLEARDRPDCGCGWQTSDKCKRVFWYFGFQATWPNGTYHGVTCCNIGEWKRWAEEIPVKLITFDELCDKSEEIRKMVQEDNE